jgi:AraC-like DNA-binding protein
MKYFEHNFNVKIVYRDYSELDRSWGLKNTVDPYIRLYYISDGRGRVICGKQDIPLEKGKFYLLPSNTPLTFWTGGFLNVYWAHVQLAAALGIDVFNIIPGKVMCLPEPEAHIIDGFKRLISGKSGTLADELGNQSLLMEIFAVFFRRYNIELPEYFEHDLRRFEPVMRIFEASEFRNFSVPELARLTGLGRVRFSTEFKRVFGLPPVKYIMRKRLERARYMLLNTDRTLEDVADELGFSDAFHFSKAFKAGIGFSPRQFRASRSLNQP